MTTMHNRERMRDRQAHADLLDQVADSTHERDEVRRILSEPLDCSGNCGMRNLNTPRLVGGCVDEADLDAHERWKRAPFAVGRVAHLHRHSPGTCGGACAQGREPCPTPQACQVAEPAEPEREPARAGDLVRVVALFLAGWAAVALALVAMGVRL